MPARAAQATEQMRPPVTQLPGPDAELVPGINGSQRIAARGKTVPGENFAELGAPDFVRVEPDQFRHLAAGANQIRCGKPERSKACEECFGQAGKAVVELKFFEASQSPVVLGCVHDIVGLEFQEHAVRRTE